jgi:hypothetical protein
MRLPFPKNSKKEGKENTKRAMGVKSQEGPSKLSTRRIVKAKVLENHAHHNKEYPIEIENESLSDDVHDGVAAAAAAAHPSQKTLQKATIEEHSEKSRLERQKFSEKHRENKKEQYLEDSRKNSKPSSFKSQESDEAVHRTVKLPPELSVSTKRADHKRKNKSHDFAFNKTAKVDGDHDEEEEEETYLDGERASESKHIWWKSSNIVRGAAVVAVAAFVASKIFKR